MHAPSLEWPGPPPKTRFAPVAAAGLGVAAFVVASYLFVQDWQRVLDLRPLELQVRANLPENGGWQSGPLRVESGRTVRLTVASVAGTHSFALAHTAVQSSRPLTVGEAETVEFTAPAPGRYVLYCTTWCSPNHWRMRTVLEVFDPAAPGAPLAYPQEPPRYSFRVEDLGLDAALGGEVHAGAMASSAAQLPALAWPEERPEATAGQALWQALAAGQTPQVALAQPAWPVVTPAQVYDHLAAGDLPGLEAAQRLKAADRWAIVAYLWQQQTTPVALARGVELYRQNCADCHGENGRGDGFAAPFAAAALPNFADPSIAAGASPARYYAKIARGGMGTGMPNWGTILGEDDLWALTAYLHSFMFDYTPEK